MQTTNVKDNSKENNRKVFEDMPIPKALATLAIPTIIGQLIVLIYSLADTFFIGRTNNPLMVAGVSLILPVFNISVSLAGLAGVGGGSLISRLLGVGEDAEAKKVSSFSFYLAILISAVFSVSMAIFMNPVLGLLGGSGEAFRYARQYTICVIVLGGIPTVLSMTMGNLLRSIGCAKQAGFGVS
ncbi:MAG: MATE family efflux transporter, partial [bacterium]|nr:MATE family efflux transporter [bacterium]